MNITIGYSPELIAQAHSIRHQVFVIEQNIPENLDLDGLDDVACHVIVSEDNMGVATARLLIRNHHAVLARIAVIKAYRGKGIAANMIRTLISYAGELGIAHMDIHAHKHLQTYYETLGFTYIQDVETVGEHPLIAMQYLFFDISA